LTSHTQVVVTTWTVIYIDDLILLCKILIQDIDTSKSSEF